MGDGGGFHDLVDMLERSVRNFGPRRLFGTRISASASASAAEVDAAWRWISYGQFGELVDEIRAGLKARGISRGDTVAIISANCVQWAAIAYATYGLGARLAPMYEHQHDDDWRYILQDCGARLLVVSTKQIHAQVSGWADSIDGLDTVLHLGEDKGDLTSLACLRQQGRDQPCPSVDLEPGEICGFIYTSGTTGQPKGVLLSHGNIVSNVNAVHRLIPMARDDISLSFLPWAHSFGQTCELHCMVSMGCTVAFAESVERLAANMLEVRPTVLFAVPRVFNKIHNGVHKRLREGGIAKRRIFAAALANVRRRRALAQRGRRSKRAQAMALVYDRLVFAKVRARFGGRLRFAFSGGAALSAEVATFMDDLGVTVLEGYGLTETSPIACANSPDVRRIGSVGKPIDDVEVCIDTSVLQDDSGHGEILVRGPNIMQGYHNLPEETAAVLGDDGFFRTGDRGYIDDDGFVWITGRIKEQYKLENGKYVVPAPIEGVLQLNSCIDQVFIYGMNRPYNIALVVPDRAVVERWAAGQGIGGDWPAIVADGHTRAMIRAELARAAASLRAFERPQRCELLAEAFTVDNGMLTPKMSVRRGAVEERYAAKIAALYSA